MFGLLTSFFTGGGVGVIGGLVGKGISLFENAQNNKYKLQAKAQELAAQERLVNLDIESMKIEAQTKIEILDKEGDIAEQRGADSMRLAAINAEKDALGKNVQASQWVVNLRGSLRPFVT